MKQRCVSEFVCERAQGGRLIAFEVWCFVCELVVRRGLDGRGHRGGWYKETSVQ